MPRHIPTILVALLIFIGPAGAQTASDSPIRITAKMSESGALSNQGVATEKDRSHLLVTASSHPDNMEADGRYRTSGRNQHGSAPVPEQDAFWARMESLCGQAFPGRISDVTPYYASVAEAESFVMHVMSCSDERIHVPFHVDDNHSRNWILTRSDGTIRLKHDHRNPDGSEEHISQYGGDAPTPGLATRQIFPADAHTASILPERDDNFWFFDFVDEHTLQYGVHWPRHGHSIRIEFDLSSPTSVPPRPWGYED
ncbi:MAG: hypothetical protein EA370_12895 [Wenzhouxiangella sp.]|nr:MAG: hypothetical protein EA370_12895 [Wenzhouxiangella sp.]